MRPRDSGSRRRGSTAALVALATAGAGLIGAGLVTQESVPTLPPQSAAAAAPAAGPSVPVQVPGGGAGSGDPVTGPLLPAARPVSLQIPSLGVAADRLQPLGLDGTGRMQVPEDGEVAGWYRHGPTPGELGPAVLAGHVDSAAEGPAVFFRLAELRPGAEVLVGREDGTTAVFTVERLAQYPKDGFPTAEVYGNTDHAALRLITCGGAFDPDARSYRDNIVAFARLTAVR